MSRTASFGAEPDPPLVNRDKLDPRPHALQAQIAQRLYTAPAGALLDALGRALQRLTRRPEPVPFWYCALLWVLLTVLLVLGLDLAFGATAHLLVTGIAQSAIQLIAVVIASMVLIGAAQSQHAMLSAIRTGIIPAMVAEADLTDLQRWLATTFRMRRQLSATLVYAVLVGGVSLFLAHLITFQVTVSFVVVLVLFALQNATAAPIVNATFALLHRLRDYEFQLYAADPSSSELIEQLAAMVGGMALRLGTLLAGVTVFMYAFGFFTFFTSILALAAPWGLLLTLFATGHQAIAAIIVQAKRRTLNAIQAKIAGLTAAGDLAEKDIMEAISRLMDYHDRVKATHNSALGIGVLLQFLQSLLLPLLASLLGSITDLRTLLFP